MYTLALRTRDLETLGCWILIAALTLALAPIARAQSFVITTVAGGDFVFRGDGLPATQAQLSQMYHAITDPQGNLLVADRSNHQVVKIAPNGDITTKGDARKTPDPFTVTASSVSARVVTTIPAGGHDEWSTRAQAIWAGST